MIDADLFVGNLGFRAYRVGGSVRDEQIGRQSKDGDYIVFGADLGAIRERMIELGAKVTALRLRDRRQVGWRAHRDDFVTIDVTLPRREQSTGPGHRDFKIVCDPQLPMEVDAQRRDFTINALYRDVRTGRISDPLGGMADLQAHIIRTTHPDSFRDDPLRILRALRLMSELPRDRTELFTLEHETELQMYEHAKHVTGLTLKGVSGTVFDELCRILDGTLPYVALATMRNTGVLTTLLPELAPIIGYGQQSIHHTLTLDEHIFSAVQAAAALGEAASTRLRMSLLFHDAGKPWMGWEDHEGYRHYYAITPEQIANEHAHPAARFSHEYWGAFLADEALERLNAPADFRRGVHELIERHMLPLTDVRSIKLRTWRSELGDDLLRDLIIHRQCDVSAKGTNEAREALTTLSKMHEQLTQDIEDGVPRVVGDLRVSGYELEGVGLKGPRIGEVQRALLHEVMAQPKLNNTDWLLTRAAKLGRAAEAASQWTS